MVSPATRVVLQAPLRILIALVLAVLSLPLLSSPASAAPANGIVIDGDRTGANDWGSLTASTPGYSSYTDPFASKKVGATPAVDDDIFLGSHEAHLPSTWGKSMGSTDTGGDIGQTYSFNTLDTAGDVWFYLGFARKEDGVGAFAVELNKEKNDLNDMPVRSQDDVRITFGQESGNADLTQVGADTWNATTELWASAGLSTSSYVGAAGEGGLFAELEINLTAARLQPPCGEGFAQVNLRSRSSDSPSALKDYVKALTVSIQARCRAIRVEKLDRTAANAPLEGASFQLFKDDGDDAFDAGDTQVGAAGTQYPASQGAAQNTYTWNDLAWGTYFVKESTRPTGYEMDPDANADGIANTIDDHVQKVVLDGAMPGDTAVVTFKNPQTKAQIRVEKFAKTGNLPALPGAKFQLYQDDGDDVFDIGNAQVGNTADTLVDDDGTLLNGEATTNQGTAPNNNTYTWTTRLAYGRYFVVESQLPAGYDTDPDSANGMRTLVLGPGDAGATVPVRFYNPPLVPKIKVSKFDGTTGDPLNGASFTLYEDTNDNEEFDGATIDGLVDGPDEANQETAPNNNSHTWDTGLSFGTTYFVEESVVPTGYDLDPTAGVTPVVGLSTVDESKAAAMKAVSVSTTMPNTLATVRFDNPRKTAQVRVEKFDNNDRSLGLTGAKFRLYEDTNGDGDIDPDDDPIGGEVTADQGTAPDNNGYTWADNLAWGHYLIQEAVAPTGYLAPTPTNELTPVEIRPADAGQVVTAKVFNVKETDGQQGPSTIVVRKWDADRGVKIDDAVFKVHFDANNNGLPDANEELTTGPNPLGVGTYSWTDAYPGQYLVEEVSPPDGYETPTDPIQAVLVPTGPPGTVYVDVDNHQKKSTIVLTKTDADTNRQVDGATFELRRNDVLVSTPPAHVEGTGVYTWSDLPMGDYTVTETDPPDGYLAPNADSLLADDVELVNIDDKNVGQTFQRGFENQQKKSTIVVEKYDDDTRQPIDGATFELLKDGQPFRGAPTRIGFGTYEWTGLLSGSYTVKELTPPPGYLRPEQDSLPDGDSMSVPILATDAGTTFAVKFYNQQKQNTIGVTKLDAENGQHIDGATFELYLDVNTNGQVDSGDTDNGAPTRTATGTYEWTRLLAGKYLVKEARAPAGYLAPATDTQTVTLADGTTKSVEFRNSPKRSGIVVTKRDARTDQPLDTASFQLWEDADADGTFDGTLDAAVGDPKDTVSGVVSWVGLRMGTYFVQETAAPKGYDLPANTAMTVVVDGDTAGGTLERTFYDPQKKTTLEVVKQDDDTREVLAGATFQAHLDVDQDGTVSDGDTEIGDPQVTDQNGVASWGGLEFGHYVIAEVAPPAGYGLPEDAAMPVVLDRDNAGTTVHLVFLDPALGGVSVAKVALEKNAAGQWVASDGEVAFGDRVKYLITARTDGAKLYRDVNVSDFVPGYDPEDEKATTSAIYVDGSADCTGDCAVSFEAGAQLLTWSLGDLRDEDRTLEFVVRMPDLPVDPVFDEDGELIETVVNVADLSWQEPATVTTQRRTAGFVARNIRSNEVVTTIAERPVLLDTPPAVQPPTGKTPQQGLPETGAPANSDLITTVAGPCVLLGAWLMLVSRRRGFLPQR